MTIIVDMYVCQACEKNCKIASNLNKHLSNCPKYSEWIKNYKKPSYISCVKCFKQFTNEIDIENHRINC